jgi:hypothetical protein
MFAGRDFQEMDWILSGDLVVPIVEMAWHNGHTKYHHLWEEYQWSERRCVHTCIHLPMNQGVSVRIGRYITE